MDSISDDSISGSDEESTVPFTYLSKQEFGFSDKETVESSKSKDQLLQTIIDQTARLRDQGGFSCERS